MSYSKKIKAFKIVIFIITILLLVGLTLYLFPIISKLFSVEGREAFKQEMEQSGTMGMFMLLGLQASQIFLPILPGEPIEILAGMCYGAVGGTIFLLVSVFLVTALIFFTVRKLGRGFVYGVCSEEKIQKLENSKMFKNPKKIEYIMLILFLIPGTPKDLLVYVAGLLPIKPLRFLIISTFARIPSIVSSTVAGSSIIAGNWKIGVVLYALIFIVVGVIIFIVEKNDKTKLTKEIIDNVRQ